MQSVLKGSGLLCMVVEEPDNVADTARTIDSHFEHPHLLLLIARGLAHYLGKFVMPTSRAI